MPREYLEILNFVDMRKFIKITMDNKFNTATSVKLRKVRTASANQEFDFEVVTNNGVYAQGLAYFTEFGCTVEIVTGKNKVVKKYDKEWALFVYQTLKEREELGLSEYKYSNCYKADYNEHIAQIRDEKLKHANSEYAQNIIK